MSYQLKLDTLVPIFKKPVLKQISPLVDSTLKLSWFCNIISAIQKKYPNDARALMEKFKDMIDLKIHFLAAQLEQIPKTGPCIIIANHPTDLLDHVIITTALSQVRRDYKFTANNRVHKLQLWSDIIFPLQIVGKNTDSSENVSSIRSSIEWLKQGNVLITYPGAKPSPLSKKTRSGGEVWSSLPMLLAKKVNAPIVPMKITLHEPWHYQLLKKFCRPAYVFMMFRVLRYFYNKDVGLGIGQAILPADINATDKREIGLELKNIVEKI